MLYPPPAPPPKKKSNMEFENTSCPQHPNASQRCWFGMFLRVQLPNPRRCSDVYASQIPGLQPENSTSRASHVLKGELVWWVDIRIYSMFSGSWLLVLSISHKNLVLKIDLYILEQKHESWDQKYIAYTFASGMPFWKLNIAWNLTALVTKPYGSGKIPSSLNHIYQQIATNHPQPQRKIPM